MRTTIGPASGLDRLSEKRKDREFMEGLAFADGTRFFVLAGGKPVVTSDADRKTSAIKWFSPKQIEMMGLAMNEAIFLGVDPVGTATFAQPTSEHFARNAPDARQHLAPIADLRNLAAQGSMTPEELSLVAQAVALVHWHENHRCCGRCGGSMSSKDAGWKKRCWSCKHEEFPRVDPVVIMAVTDGDRILLAHEERFPDKMFSTLAGYVEPGDDIEGAVRRETAEEVGVEVGSVEVLGSQPWPFPHSLMIGCFAVAQTTAITVNTAEVQDARWFARDEAAAMLAGRHLQELWLPGPQSMAHHLVKTFLARTG
ncbi:MAG: NAD(+) diphosphatase [Hyphomicrobiaceae bacterium]|nr:NAD(+) diphosphatase [Hyphomicrobiaceae bacterium]